MSILAKRGSEPTPLAIAVAVALTLARLLRDPENDEQGSVAEQVRRLPDLAFGHGTVDNDVALAESVWHQLKNPGL